MYRQIQMQRYIDRQKYIDRNVQIFYENILINRQIEMYRFVTKMSRPALIIGTQIHIINLQAHIHLFIHISINNFWEIFVNPYLMFQKFLQKFFLKQIKKMFGTNLERFYENFPDFLENLGGCPMNQNKQFRLPF